MIEPHAPRYARQVIVPGVGTRGQRALADAHVALIGAGGLGSPAAAYLAGAGVGRLTIIDDDVVDESNLHRQIIHRTSDVGVAKAESAARFVRELNPQVGVTPVVARLNPENAFDILDGVDVVLDGSDNFATRYLADDACALLGLPLVWGAILRTAGQVSVFTDRVRYRDVFGEPPAPGAIPSCAEAGVIGPLCGIIGSAMAAEAMKLITGLGEPLVGRLALFDAAEFSWRTVEVAADPSREPVRSLAGTISQACATPESVGVQRVSVDELKGLAQGGEVLLLDVRAPGEVADSPVPAGWRSLHVPTSEFDAAKVAGMVAGDSPRVVVACASGVRAARAAHELAGMGIAAQALSGGVHELPPLV